MTITILKQVNQGIAYYFDAKALEEFTDGTTSAQMRLAVAIVDTETSYVFKDKLGVTVGVRYMHPDVFESVLHSHALNSSGRIAAVFGVTNESV
jgi:hypothetical protein